MSLLTNYKLIMRYTEKVIRADSINIKKLLNFFLIEYIVVECLITHSATLLDLACTTIIAR